MAETTYDYSITTDFPNDKVDCGKLTVEIQSSSITIALERIDTSGDDCDIIFKDSLTTGEETTLDGLVAAHDGEPLQVISPVILEPTGDTSKNLIVHGRTFSATLDDVTNEDISFSEDRYFQGLTIEIQDFTDGDYIRISLYNPGKTAELRVFAEGENTGEGVPIPPSGLVNVIAEGTALVPTGYHIRLKYNSIGTTGNQPKVFLLIRQWN